jgi:hypothetical protein
MVRPAQPLPKRPHDRHPVLILWRQSQGQIAEAFIPRPLDTSAEEMFRRQNPVR